MKSDKKFSDVFDDDFEVTYEEEPDVGFTDSESPEAVFTEDEPDTAISDEEPYFEDIDEPDSDYDTAPLSGYDEDRSSHSKRRGGVPLAAPIKKGGKLLSRLASALIRQLSLILIIATAAYVTYNFWRASTPYGDILESVQSRSITMTLAAYLSCVAIFVLFELISLLWAMTRTRVHDGIRSWKEDTGRGLFSFVVVFAVSYLSFFLAPHLPDSPEVIYGLKGALNVYGSLHNALFGLCAAGVISCLVRRYKSSS